MDILSYWSGSRFFSLSLDPNFYTFYVIVKLDCSRPAQFLGRVLNSFQMLGY